eukprot:109008-Hanusia_phi.AAC.3
MRLQVCRSREEAVREQEEVCCSVSCASFLKAVQVFSQWKGASTRRRELLRRMTNLSLRVRGRRRKKSSSSSTNDHEGAGGREVEERSGDEMARGAFSKESPTSHEETMGETHPLSPSLPTLHPPHPPLSLIRSSASLCSTCTGRDGKEEMLLLVPYPQVCRTLRVGRTLRAFSAREEEERLEVATKDFCVQTDETDDEVRNLRRVVKH